MTSYANAAQDRDANRQIISSNEAFKLESTWTFATSTTGAIGQHTIFTVTGNVGVDMFIALCDSDLTSGGAATISIGTANRVNGITTATTATDIDDGDVWLDGTPQVEVASVWAQGGADKWLVINDGADITMDILSFAMCLGNSAISLERIVCFSPA